MHCCIAICLLFVTCEVYVPDTRQPQKVAAEEAAAARQKQAQEAAARQKQAVEEATCQKKAAEEATRQKQAAEEAARQKQAAEEAARQKQAEEEARQKVEEETARRVEDAIKQAEENVWKQRQQHQQQQAAEEAAQQAQRPCTPPRHPPLQKAAPATAWRPRLKAGPPPLAPPPGPPPDNKEWGGKEEEQDEQAAKEEQPGRRVETCPKQSAQHVILAAPAFDAASGMYRVTCHVVLVSFAFAFFQQCLFCYSCSWLFTCVFLSGAAVVNVPGTVAVGVVAAAAAGEVPQCQTSL